ncbi:hypothetical protein PF004_g11247 [Phytophthora fragariae]|uniref:Uncharacterized protein n=1 Tax=Phytophthora fragariae TaxID=53985 RepID=A0A6G0NYM1_9STRA|nr:hypothetical protein PF004_g11247 [Phytophthora fragariae]
MLPCRWRLRYCLSIDFLHISVSPCVGTPNIQVLVHGCWVGLGHYTSGQYIPISLVGDSTI